MDLSKKALNWRKGDSMKTIPYIQGTPEWHAERSMPNTYTASEASAMLGLSKYKTRAELVREKAIGITHEVDSFTQGLFDAGHEDEASTRAWAEAEVGDDLYPVTGTIEVEGMRLLASFDGLTMDESIAWENKKWNQEFSAQVLAGEVPDTHWPQLEQQLLVSGAKKVLFTVSDGGNSSVAHLWYTSQHDRRARLIAGWKQFSEDVANYQHVEVIPAAVAAPIKDLPAIVITASGSLTIETNFARWGVELREFIAKIPDKPETDQDFADCNAAITAFKKAEKMLDTEEQRVLSMVTSIEEMQREKKLLFDLSRTTRLSLEKLVVSRDLAVKAEIIQAGKDQLAEYVVKLNDSIGGNWIPAISADFSQAIKNKRSYESMRSSVADMVAHKKVEAKGIADRINQNRQELVGELDWSFLFPDWTAVCTKPCDDFAALLSMRITNHRAAEEKRMEAEREKIRAEEQAKAEREAKAKAERDQAERDAEAARVRAAEQAELEKQRAKLKEEADSLARQKEEAELLQREQEQKLVDERKREQARIEPTVYIAGQVPDETGFHPIANVTPIDEGKTIKLGEICSRLGFAVTADFLAQLGFQPHAIDKNAKLYRECDFNRICTALISHIQSAMLWAQKSASSRFQAKDGRELTKR